MARREIFEEDFKDENVTWILHNVPINFALLKRVKAKADELGIDYKTYIINIVKEKFPEEE